MKNLRAILFDAVGTLVYPEPSVVEVYYHWGQEHGSAKTDDEVAERLPFAMAARWRDDLKSSDALERARWQSVVADVFGRCPADRAVVRGPLAALRPTGIVAFVRRRRCDLANPAYARLHALHCVQL